MHFSECRIRLRWRDNRPRFAAKILTSRTGARGEALVRDASRTASAPAPHRHALAVQASSWNHFSSWPLVPLMNLVVVLLAAAGASTRISRSGTPALDLTSRIFAPGTHARTPDISLVQVCWLL